MFVNDAAIHVNQRWSPFGKSALMEGEAIATEARTPISKSSSNRETVTIALDAEHKVSIQLGISAGVLETN